MTQQTLPRTATPTTTPRRRRRSTSITLWTLQVLTAVTFAFAGVGKVTGDPQSVAGFEQIGLGDWFRLLIGALEVAGAVGVLIPRLSGLAAACFSALMVGAVITQATVFDGEMLAVPAVVFLVVAVIAWGRRDTTARLFASPRRR